MSGTHGESGFARRFKKAGITPVELERFGLDESGRIVNRERAEAVLAEFDREPVQRLGLSTDELARLGLDESASCADALRAIELAVQIMDIEPEAEP
ncbi:MAG: hypothetical protein J2P25_15915 [Nocardiopsaceae bacterium]|nr:hypothetical protein [Nocardiopsaceae bacterium]